MNDVTPEACQSYAQGHQMHWIHWKHVRRSAPLSASVVRLNSKGIVLSVDVGRPRRPELSFWHHDMERLESIIEAEDAILVYPKLHALQVGNFMFNCSTKPRSSKCTLWLGTTVVREPA